MAVFQKEAGVCTGRGFAAIDAAGYCAKFYTWITKAPASGGPGWTILLDKSATPALTEFTVPDHTNDKCYHVNHGLYTGDTLQVSSTTTLPAGLSASTDYYVIKVDADNFYLATSMSNAQIGTKINITGAGTGTHSFLEIGPYIVVSDQAAPTINQACMILRVGYRTSEAARVRFQSCLSFDTTNKILYGYWHGKQITTVDSGDFAYDFRGGAECMIIQSRISSTWYCAGIDSWTGDANFVEGTDKTGTLASGITAGSSVVLSLGSGEAANFTVNKYYYLYDFNGHSWVDYCKVTARDTGADTITVDRVDFNYTAGSVIAAYAHRFYGFGSDTATLALPRFNYGLLSRLPYASSQGYVSAGQSSILYAGCQIETPDKTLITNNPNDLGYYACSKGLLVEYLREDSSGTGMNRAYGSPNNIYLCYNNSYSPGQDGKTIGGENYLFFLTGNYIYSTGSASSQCSLFLDTTATS